MKLVFVFKDGLTYTQDYGSPLSIQGEGDFLDRLHQGKTNNTTLTLSDKEGNTVQKRYSDLESVNIIMD